MLPQNPTAAGDHSGVCDQLVNKEALWPSQLASLSVHLKTGADTWTQSIPQATYMVCSMN